MIEILERSYNPYSDTTLTTLVAEYPRIIHAELLTHRVLSRNSASSRAIPSLSMTELVLNKPFIPEQWFKNAKGMSPAELLDVESAEECKKIWMELIEFTAAKVKRLTELQLHKSYANRPLEPFSHIKVIISGTEWDNFYNLRCSRPAQEEFIKLANAIKEAQNNYAPISLKEGQWHLPFIKSVENSKGIVEYYDNIGNRLSLEEAKIVSASCCAQISYRKEDSTIEKARNVFKQLIESDPSHFSPVEHMATPIVGTSYDGITHIDKYGNKWSGNLKGWLQWRQLL
jgi:thymidylate synthase ThyX